MLSIRAMSTRKGPFSVAWPLKYCFFAIRTLSQIKSLFSVRANGVVFEIAVLSASSRFPGTGGSPPGDRGRGRCLPGCLLVPGPVFGGSGLAAIRVPVSPVAGIAPPARPLPALRTLAGPLTRCPTCLSDGPNRNGSTGRCGPTGPLAGPGPPRHGSTRRGPLGSRAAVLAGGRARHTGRAPAAPAGHRPRGRPKGGSPAR